MYKCKKVLLNTKKVLLNTITITLISTVLLFISSLASAQSAIPPYINYQGRLIDQASGAPVNGVKSITFALYDSATGGAPIYSQTQPVTITNGAFSVYLGKGEGNYQGEKVSDGIPAEVFTEHSARYLGIKMEDSSAEMAPRQLLSSVAYAYKAEEAEKARVAESVMGQVTANSTGNVGIGTISPSEKLEVTGNIKAAGAVKATSFEGDGSKLTGVLLRKHSLDAADGKPVDAVYVDNEGDVGIGTTAPAGRLHVSVPPLPISNDDPTPSMLSASGLGLYSPTTLLDNLPSGNSMSTNGATAGAWLKIDVGAGNEKAYVKARMYTGSGGNANFTIQYSDNDSAWSNAATNFWVTQPHWNEIAWSSQGAHRYWRFLLTNTPGNGPWYNELEMFTDIPCSDADLVVSNSGNLGIGTTEPSGRLEVNIASSDSTSLPLIIRKGATSYVTVSNSGNVGIGPTTKPTEPTGGLEITQGGEYTVDPGTLVLRGGHAGIRLKAGGGGHVPYIRFTTDDGGDEAIEMGLGNSAGKPFYFNRSVGQQEGGAAVVINNSGNLGIGTTSPSYKLHVAGDAMANHWYTSSDSRLKENITPLTNAIDKVSALRGIYFNLKGESPSKREVGVIAQEVEAMLPEVVSEDAQGYKSVDYSKLTPLLIEATKAQQVQIEGQQAQIEEQRAQIESQQVQIEALKALICQGHPEAEICQ
jgi:hypothetical protein